MIQIYAPSNTNFNQNGTALLPISCVWAAEINGSWTIEIDNAIDDRFQNIVENAVLKAPTPFGENLYRITQCVKTNSGITATALPIFLDAQNDTFIYDQRPTNQTGQGALDILTNGTKYTGYSDIITPNTAYYIMKNLIQCLASDDENSFLNRWGGEIRYSDYDVYINQRLGADNGARVEFGFNLSSIEESIDMSSVVTRIIPTAYNGYTLPDNETVDSPNIESYPIIYIRQITYEDIKLAEDAQADDVENGITICDTLDELYEALRTRAQAEYTAGIDIPTITYQVDMVDLAKTQEYAQFKDLVTVNLGDTVHVKHRRLGIETTARVIAMEYDCIAQKVTSLTIGDYAANYFDSNSDITSAANQVIDKSNNTLMANRIAGVLNLLNTSLRAQKDIAQRQDVRAILFEDLDTESPTFGALCLGTQGIQISKQRNETDTDWVWGTAIDFESIVADYIITGILTDKSGNFYLNLDTGELKMNNGTFEGTIDSTTINGGTINGTEISTEKDINVGRNVILAYEDGNVSRSIKLGKEAIVSLAYSSLWNTIDLRVNKDSDKYVIAECRAANSQSSNNFVISLKHGSKETTHLFGLEQSTINGTLLVDNLSVTGSKNRLVKTENFGNRLMNAVESANAVFEDFGSSETNEKGEAFIKFDEVFMETVNTEYEYQVFLQDYVGKSIQLVEKEKDGFMVFGNPNSKFDWRICARQKGYEEKRMEVAD
jgi:phage minor structural protein